MKPSVSAGRSRFVLDRRGEDPVMSGPFAQGFRRFLDPSGHLGRVAVVLNRKGRSRLLACKACGELVRTIDGRDPMILTDGELVSRDGRESRPAVCVECGSTVLRNLRMGVTRAREELAALVREPVGELTSDTAAMPPERIVIGTEALLWRIRSASRRGLPRLRPRTAGSPTTSCSPGVGAAGKGRPASGWQRWQGWCAADGRWRSLAASRIPSRRGQGPARGADPAA